MADEITLQDEYKAELKASAQRYFDREKAGYAAILVAVTAEYRGQIGGYRRMMHEVQRRCAAANHFPGFETWCETRAQLDAMRQSA
ncbi:MAG TPA: hypothetical protein VGP82_06405 [Ktedonobacterales bacterium]|nr:hypothetical protein [Ktedonobacterales bacterium]